MAASPGRGSNSWTTKHLQELQNGNYQEVDVGVLERPLDFCETSIGSSPCVFISNTDRDKVKLSLARPTHWFLTKILDVDAFLDREDASGGRDVGAELYGNAMRSTHALVLVTPNFRKRKYCVLELNTFMERIQKGDGCRVFVALWLCETLDGYAQDVNNIIWLKPDALRSPVDYLVQFLWPRLSRELQKPIKSRNHYEKLLAEYIHTHRGEDGADTPNEFETFCKRRRNRMVVALSLVLTLLVFLIFAVAMTHFVGGCWPWLCSSEPAATPGPSPVLRTAAPSFAQISYAQLGQDILGSPYGILGCSLALSGNGTILVAGDKGRSSSAGFVQVFRWSGLLWKAGDEGREERIKTDFQGNNEHFGYSVAISEDGQRVLVGNPLHDWGGGANGSIHFFELGASFAWHERAAIGSTVFSDSLNDQLGTSVSISSDIYAAGAPFSAHGDGYVRIFKRMANGNMARIADVAGFTTHHNHNPGSRHGQSIALSRDGSTLAVGGPFLNTTEGDRIGKVTVFRCIGGNWRQIGQTLGGSYPGDFFGRSVALSEDGGLLVVGADQWPDKSDLVADTNSAGAGYVRTFRLNALGSWGVASEDIVGMNSGEKFGWSVALSSSGKRLAIMTAFGGLGIFLNENGIWERVLQQDESFSRYGGVDFWNRRAVAISSDGSTVAVSGQICGLDSIRVFREHSDPGATLSPMPEPVSTAPVDVCNAFSVDGTTLIGDDNDAWITGSTLPTCLGDLTQLTSLTLAYEFVSGSIPIQLGSLTALTYLDLSGNRLTGTIPTQLGSLTALTYLSLSSNQLKGTIPTQLGSLTALTYLSLSSNQLTGTIPTQLGSLTALAWLWLQNNQLTGTIPAQLGSLTALTYLWLHNNQLTGTIPEWVSDSTGIDLTGNNFVGR